MKLLVFTLEHYLVVGIIGLVAWLMGRSLTQRLTFDSSLEGFSFSLSLGFGCLAYIILLLGLLKILYLPVVVISILIALVILYVAGSGGLRAARAQALVLKAGIAGRIGPALAWAGVIAVLFLSLPIFVIPLFSPRRWLAGFQRRLKLTNPVGSLVTLVAILLLVVLLVPLLLLPLYPPSYWDDIWYHLPYARAYIEHHALVLTPYLNFPVSPQTNEMLFALALLFHDDLIAQLIELLLLANLFLLTVAAGRRFVSGRVGWWAGAILVSNPLIIWLGVCAYVEICTALFVSATIYAAGIWALRELVGAEAEL